MTSALAPQLNFLQIDTETTTVGESDGAHSLLGSPSFRPAYFAQGAAILVYALALAGLCYLSKPKPAPQDQPIELTMVADDTPAPIDTPDTTPTPPAVSEQTPDAPPVTDPTPPEQTAVATPDAPPPPDEDLPPLAADQQENVAPVAPPLPPVAIKHRQRLQAVATRATSSRHTASAPAASRAAPGAAPSYYANEVHARVAQVAGDTVPDDFHGSGRVLYHIVISPSGELISKSITPSGNTLFDRAAAEALARAAPFPPTGMPRPVSLHGAIAYSQ
jgi:protein TonB